MDDASLKSDLAANAIPGFSTQGKGGLCIVTGCSSGMGLAHAMKCAGAGMIVVGTDISGGKFAEVEKELRSAGAQDVCLLTADVGKMSEMAKVAADVKARFGGKPIRVIYANAGFSTPLLLNGTPESIQGGNDVMINGVIWTFKAFQDWFLNQTERCALVATSSVAGIMPSAGSYGVGKHACVAIMESLHEELLGRKALHVTTHVLCPGVVNSNFFTDPRQGADEKVTTSGQGLTGSYGAGDDRAKMGKGMRDMGANRGMLPSHMADEVFNCIEKGIFYIIVDGDQGDASNPNDKTVLNLRGAEIAAFRHRRLEAGAPPPTGRQIAEFTRNQNKSAAPSMSAQIRSKL